MTPPNPQPVASDLSLVPIVTLADLGAVTELIRFVLRPAFFTGDSPASARRAVQLLVFWCHNLTELGLCRRTVHWALLFVFTGTKDAAASDLVYFASVQVAGPALRVGQPGAGLGAGNPD